MALIVKRVADIAGAAVGLLVLGPLMLVVAALVWVSMGSPVLFRQLRAGYEGCPFALHKFRSMTDTRDAAGNPLPDRERVTALGRFLRKSSLDELPELWNVLKGEMSLVGPRPLVARYLDRYTPQQARRHEARPGLTGWAQVHGRNALDWEERFVCDVWYVDHWSLWLDLRIIVRTVHTVLVQEGISAAGQATVEEFRGTPTQSPSAELRR